MVEVGYAKIWKGFAAVHPDIISLSWPEKTADKGSECDEYMMKNTVFKVRRSLSWVFIYNYMIDFILIVETFFNLRCFYLLLKGTTTWLYLMFRFLQLWLANEPWTCLFTLCFVFVRPKREAPPEYMLSIMSTEYFKYCIKTMWVLSPVLLLLWINSVLFI